MKNISIKIKVTLSVIILLGLLAGIITYLTYENSIHVINDIAKESLASSRESYNNLEQEESKALSATLEALMLNETYQKLFKDRDRSKLFAATAPVYNSLKANYGITHWYFLNPEGQSTTFLRVHMPGKFDDLVNRATYLDSVMNKDFSSGKELGKTAFALRVVHPYRDNKGKLLGYMELGMEIDHFIDQMKKQSGSEFTIIAEKRYLDEKEWASICSIKHIRNNWNDFQDILMISSTSTDSSLFQYKGQISEIPDSGLVLDFEKRKDLVFTKGIIPLYDATKTKVGAVFILKDITHDYTEMIELRNKTIVVVILVTIFLCFVLLFILNKMIFKRLEHTASVMVRVVGGDFNTKIAVTAHDEIGQFEKLLDDFRKLFVNTVRDLTKYNK